MLRGLAVMPRFALAITQYHGRNQKGVGTFVVPLPAFQKVQRRFAALGSPCRKKASL